MSERGESGLSVGARFSLVYAALFLQVGVALPFFPVVIAGQGLSPSRLALVLAAIAGARTIVTPLLGFLSDRFRLWRGFLVLIGLGAALGYAGFGMVHGFWGLLLLAFLLGPLYAAITPIIDAHALRSAERRGGDFGRMRLWGSVAFLVTNIVGGALIGVLGASSITAILVSLTVLGALSVLLLPGGVHGAPGSAPRIGMTDVRKLLTMPRFLAVLLIGGGIQTTHVVLYNFGTLVWRDQGMGSTEIGLLWAIGVSAEVALLSFGKLLVARFGAERMLMLGGAAGALRWGVLALAPPLFPLLILQLLHAFTFALTYIAAIHLVQRAVPAQLAATAQTIYTVGTSGIFASAMTVLAGPLYAHFGAGVYAAPAMLAGLCALAALFLFETALIPIEPVAEEP